MEPSLGARLEDDPKQSVRPLLMWQGLDGAIVHYFASFDKTEGKTGKRQPLVLAHGAQLFSGTIVEPGAVNSYTKLVPLCQEVHFFLNNVGRVFFSPCPRETCS